MARKKANPAPAVEEPKPKKKPGRQPMSAEEKEAAAKLRAEEKEKASNLKPELVIQYQGSDVSMETLVETAEANFHKTHKRTLITALKLYVKPEERMAYYVINGDCEGSFPY